MTVAVVAAIIRKNGKILIAQRKADSKLEASRWEFPGGKIEFGEHPEEALRREIKEELGIRIKVKKLHSVLSHVYDFKGRKLHVVLLVFLADHVSGKVRNLDVQDSRWIRRDQLREFEFVPADRKLVEELSSG